MEEVGSGEAVAEADNVDSNREDDNALEQHGHSTSLPLGWIEIIDEESGAPYYYNEESNVTTWDKPMAENDATQQGEDADSQQDPRSQSPPLSPQPDQSPPMSPSPSTPPPQSPIPEDDDQQQQQSDNESIQPREEEVIVEEKIEEEKEDPRELKLKFAKEALAKPDSILEPRAAEHLVTLVTEEKKKGQDIAMKSLVSTYGSMVSSLSLLNVERCFHLDKLLST